MTSEEASCQPNTDAHYLLFNQIEADLHFFFMLIWRQELSRSVISAVFVHTYSLVRFQGHNQRLGRVNSKEPFMCDNKSYSLYESHMSFG